MTKIFGLLLAACCVTAAALGVQSTTPSGIAPHGSSPQFPTFNLKCLGYADNQVIFTNFGNAPVPAGTYLEWHTDATSTEPKARNGTYLFQTALAPQASVGINWPPPPSSGSDQGGGVPQVFAPLALEFMTPCRYTFTRAPVRAPTPQTAPLRVNP